MNYSEDHIALAAEYALGTLDADERALVETMMIVDHGFMEVVDAWDRKLSPLHQMVAPVEPPPHLWDNIKNAIGIVDQPAQPVSEPEPVEQTPVSPTVSDQFEYANIGSQQPEATSSVSATPTGDADVPVAATIASDQVAQGQVTSDQAAPDRAETAAAMPEIMSEPVVEQPSNVVALSDRKRGGSNAFGWVMTAVAASLAGVIALQAYRPELLPENLRVKPKIQVVEVAAPTAPLPAQFVAVLQQNAAAPAFILTVDTATKNFTVRKVGATPEPGKSYELWLVSDKLQRPRSLGVIGGSDFTIRPSLAAYDVETINKATYAVTIEPEGGSPTGVATGPIVYTGKLVESVPALPAQPR